MHRSPVHGSRIPGWCHPLALAKRCVLWCIALAFLISQQPALGHGYQDQQSTFTQPDGTVLKLSFHGSEYYARTTTEDGYTVVFDPDKKAYFYATTNADASELLATPHQVGKANPLALGLQKELRLNSKARAAKIEKRRNEVQAVLKDRERWEALKAANKNYRKLQKEVIKQKKAGKKGFVVPMGTLFPDTDIPEGSQGAQMAEGDPADGGDGPQQAPPNFTLTEDVVGLTILVDFDDAPGTAGRRVDRASQQPAMTGWP